MGQKQILCSPITRQPNPATGGSFIGDTLAMLRITRLPTRTRCVWVRTHCTVYGVMHTVLGDMRTWNGGRSTSSVCFLVGVAATGRESEI
jgi:hypothetical protein